MMTILYPITKVLYIWIEHRLANYGVCLKLHVGERMPGSRHLH